MTAASRNALHVVRLVLRGQQDLLRRTYSVSVGLSGSPTASFQFNSDSASSGRDAAMTSASTSAIQPLDFLEDRSSEEYAQAQISLSRFPAQPHALRWPSVFAPRLREELVALPDLVRSGDHAKATETLRRLLENGIKPPNLKIYLAMAQQSLEQGDKEAFLSWLSIYPRIPPSFIERPVHDACKQITTIIRTEHEFDVSFARRCMMVFAQKGLLPSTMTGMIYQLTRTVPPLDSLDIIHETIKKYYAAFDKHGAKSAYACKLRAIADAHSNRWWNRYVRYLMTAGHVDEARAFYARMQVGDWYVRATEATQALMSKRGAAGKKATARQRQKEVAALVKSIRLALKDGTSTQAIADVLTLMEPYVVSHPTLIDRFKRRWAADRTIPQYMREVRARRLVHAEISLLAAKGQHREAVEYYQSKYHWSGIPPHPAEEWVRIVPGRVVNAATISDVNAILPSLLLLLGDKTAVRNFFHQYLNGFAQHPLALLPNEMTWKLFVQYITRICGIEEGENALRAICESNVDPGHDAYTSFLISLLRAGKMEEADRLLIDMLTGMTYHGILLPVPTKETLFRLEKHLRFALVNGFVPGPGLHDWVASLSVGEAQKAAGLKHEQRDT